MQDKTFTVVGTSVKAGVKKLRLANGTAAARAKVLEKDNHTEIQLFDLPSAMTQDAATKWLEARGTDISNIAERSAKIPAASTKTVDNTPKTRSVRKPQNPIEALAHKLHRKTPFIRQLAWDHLKPEIRRQYMTEAREKIAA
jgi:hypothetical protein